jgi:hypothetical protein
MPDVITGRGTRKKWQIPGCSGENVALRRECEYQSWK